MQCFLLPSPVFLPPRASRRHSHWRCGPPPRALATRTRLLNLLSTVPLSSPTTDDVETVEECIRELLQYRSIPPGSDDLTGETGGWGARLNGRWNLAFSTETPLRKILGTVGEGLGNGGVYQLLDNNTLQNVISTTSTALVVDGEYERVTEEDIRACPFTFRGTRLLTGGAVTRFRGADAKGGIDIRVGFAIGKGRFQVLWLDHSLRIDRDTSTGEEWLNVYFYGGPVVPCRAGLSG